MKPELSYTFHHVGIPSQEVRPDERYSPTAKMFTADHSGQFKIQWHRFEADSPLHPLIRTQPHLAFQVDDLQAAIAGEQLILGPYQPIDGYFVAMINDNGMPVELIQTQLSDQALWALARSCQGAIYR